MGRNRDSSLRDILALNDRLRLALSEYTDIVFPILRARSEDERFTRLRMQLVTRALSLEGIPRWAILGSWKAAWKPYWHNSSVLDPALMELVGHVHGDAGQEAFRRVLALEQEIRMMWETHESILDATGDRDLG